MCEQTVLVNLFGVFVLFLSFIIYLSFCIVQLIVFFVITQELAESVQEVNTVLFQNLLLPAALFVHAYRHLSIPVMQSSVLV